jgi:tetratricopeptide (TPR) repeat protein
LEIVQRTKTEKKSLISAIYNNIGELAESNKDFIKAMEYYKKSLDLSLNSSSAEQLDIANAYHNIANLHIGLTNLDSAFVYINKSLKIKLEQTGENHPSIAVTYKILADAYIMSNDIPNAIAYYQKALGIQQNNIHLKGDIYFALAHIYYVSCPNFPKSLEYFSKSKKIFEQYPEKYMRTAITSNIMGTILLSMGNSSDAMEHFKESSKLLFENRDDKNNIEMLNNAFIGFIYENIPDKESAKKHYKKALKIYHSFKEPEQDMTQMAKKLEQLVRNL